MNSIKNTVEKALREAYTELEIKTDRNTGRRVRGLAAVN